MNSELAFNLPGAEPLIVDREIVARAMETHSRSVFAFVVGTKPCFNKVYGSMRACEKVKVPFFVVDAGQHHDANLVHGIDEFGFREHIGASLNIRGDLNQKCAELFTKIPALVKWLRSNWKTPVIPIVNGDTILCPIVPAAWMFTTGEKLAVQNEAGLRSVWPEIEYESCPFEHIINLQHSGRWIRDTSEPFPEQWDTYCAAAGCMLHLAPTERNVNNLLSEGHRGSGIVRVGGLVLEALRAVEKSNPIVCAFEQYPKLQSGKWLRVDIHRKENLSENRLRAIVGLVDELVHMGRNVNFVMMNATLQALNGHGLASRIDMLNRYENFQLTPVWSEYSSVVEFYKSDNFLAAITDSGGVQEDMNILGKPCITIRHSTDRPETIFLNNGNLLAPPISSMFLVRFVNHILDEELPKMTPQPVYEPPSETTGHLVAKALMRYT